MARLKLTLVLDSGARIGPGKVALLESVRDTGSISAAARAMGMDYKRAWLLIDSLNRAFATPVVERAAGGPRGGGATLTAFGEELLARYRRLQGRGRGAGGRRPRRARAPRPARRRPEGLTRDAPLAPAVSFGYRYGIITIAVRAHGGSARDGRSGRGAAAAFGGGAVIGALGGLIGLGGAEFRLPLLIGAFRFAALEAVILNKAMSLVVVASALPFRAAAVPFEAVAAHWAVILNLLAGSLLGAWLGAGWATRLRSETLHRVIAVLLVAIAAVLLLGHDAASAGAPPLEGHAPGRRRRRRRVRDRRRRLAPGRGRGRAA